MKESLTSRVGRLISGGFNALVDAVENSVPESVMEEAIREIEGTIDDVRTELGRAIANKHLANTRLLDENTKHESLAESIEVAVKEGRDDLAEAAIAKQMDIEAQIPVLEATISESAQKEKELESFIAALQAKKREMQDELLRFREAKKESIANATGSVPGSTNKASGVGVKAEKATQAFDRVLEKATGLSSSKRTTSMESEAKVAELEALVNKNRIAERLAAIKSNMDK